jgi:hypothetical protein
MARDTIDTLSALEARTKGNLESDEARVLTQVLHRPPDELSGRGEEGGRQGRGVGDRQGSVLDQSLEPAARRGAG